ncbi:MAG: CBS domain-containing protein [Deltaproteobacteria bacterium]|nr:CBS domain-containing protein [Deltaproteobacteria bacterium]
MANQTLRDKVQDKLAELKSLREQIVVDLHLAGMELRSEWKTIEKNLPDPSAAAEHLKGMTADAVESAAEQLRKFRSRLSQSGRGTIVEGIMTTSVATCRPTDSLAAAVVTMPTDTADRALQRMSSAQVNRLPVLNSDNLLLGIVTLKDAANVARQRSEGPEPTPVSADIVSALTAIGTPTSASH